MPDPRPLSTLLDRQHILCGRYGASWLASPDHLKAGVARNVGTGVVPLNGLRRAPQGETTGWYIWAGEELSSAPDLFEPVHVAHLAVSVLKRWSS